VLEGLPSSTPAVQRLNGFKDGVKLNPKIKVVAEQAADWVPDKAQTAFSAMLQANPRHQGRLREQRHDGGRLLSCRQGRGKEGQIGIHRHDGLPDRPGGCAAVALGTMGRDVHLSDGGGRSLVWPRKSAGLRGIGTRYGDGADAGRSLG